MKMMAMGAMGALFALALCGCTASDGVSSSSVSSASSAVESAPAPPEEDMRKKLNYYCHTACLIRAGECSNGCTDEANQAACDSQCDEALFNCADMCERVFPW